MWAVSPCASTVAPVGTPPEAGTFLQRRLIRRVEDDHAVPAPGAAAALFRVAQRQGRSTRNIDLLELPAREKSDEAAVGRPEGRRSAVSSGERLRGERVQRADPQEICSVRVRGHKGDPTAIGRDCQGRRRSDRGGAESRQGPGRRNEKPYRRGVLRSTPEIRPRTEGHSRNQPYE